MLIHSSGNEGTDFPQFAGECLYNDLHIIIRKLIDAYLSSPIPCLSPPPETRYPVTDCDHESEAFPQNPFDCWLPELPELSDTVPAPDNLPRGTQLLVSAYCIPLVYPWFQKDLMKNREVIFACTRLNSIVEQRRKLTTILERSNLKSLMVAHLDVPCCTQLALIANQARSAAKHPDEMTTLTIAADGTVLNVNNATRKTLSKVGKSRSTGRNFSYEI